MCATLSVLAALHARAALPPSPLVLPLTSSLHALARCQRSVGSRRVGCPLARATPCAPPKRTHSRCSSSPPCGAPVRCSPALPPCGAPPVRRPASRRPPLLAPRPTPHPAGGAVQGGESGAHVPAAHAAPAADHRAVHARVRAQGARALQPPPPPPPPACALPRPCPARPRRSCCAARAHARASVRGVRACVCMRHARAVCSAALQAG